MTLSERRRILNDIFNLNLTEQEFLSQDNGYEAFFDWYEEQCEGAPAEMSITDREILRVVALLKSPSDRTRAEIVDGLRQQSTAKSDSLLNSSVILAARVWLMLSIGNFQQSLSPSRGVIWNDDGKLADVIAAELCPRNTTRSSFLWHLPHKV